MTAPEKGRWYRFKNWLHYHWLYLIIAAVVLWVGISWLANALHWGETLPDYQIAYVGKSALPEDTAHAIEAALAQYGEDTLSNLKCRKLITFHDGFSYFADAFDLTIVKAVEEESGSEASARDLIELITLVEENALPAVFTETSGSSSAANIISRETGCGVCPLDMAMSGSSYFDAMYHNIDTIKEALG